MSYLILSGSAREQSNTRIVAQYAFQEFQKHTQNVSFLDLKEVPESAFSKQSFQEVDSKTKDYLQKVNKAKALFLVVPEYNGSFPGIFKHFIDLWEYPQAFDGKIISFVGLAAGPWGGSRPIDHLTSIFTYRETIIFSKKTLIPFVTQEIKNKVISSKVTERLDRQIDNFIRLLFI